MGVLEVDLTSIAERGLKKAEELGVSEAEVYVAYVRRTVISGGPRGLERVTGGRYLTASVRVAIGRRLSMQSVLMPVPDHIDSVVAVAVEAAKASVEDRRWVSLPRKYGRSSVVDIVDDRVRYPDLGYFIELVRDGMRLPKEVDRRVSVTDVRLMLSHMVKAICNSYHGVQESEKTAFKYYIEVKAVDSDTSSYYGYYSAPTLKGFSLEGTVREAVEVSLRTLNARHVETGTYDVVLMPRAFSSVVTALLVPAVRADNVQMGRSPLAGRLGCNVLSEELTIIDDGTLPDMSGSTEFDGEGVATGRKTIFDKGVLRTYLYDTYTANAEGVESTGNAVRSWNAVYPDVLNLVVGSGAERLDSLVGDLRKGLVVYGVIGEWLSNPVSGYLNMTVTNALYVEQGDVRYGVRDVVLSGSVYDMLSRGLRGISKECTRTSNTLVPAVVLGNVVIAGS